MNPPPHLLMLCFPHPPCRADGPVLPRVRLPGEPGISQPVGGFFFTFSLFCQRGLLKITSLILSSVPLLRGDLAVGRQYRRG